MNWLNFRVEMLKNVLKFGCPSSLDNYITDRKLTEQTNVYRFARPIILPCQKDDEYESSMKLIKAIFTFSFFVGFRITLQSLTRVFFTTESKVNIIYEDPLVISQKSSESNV